MDRVAEEYDLPLLGCESLADKSHVDADALDLESHSHIVSQTSSSSASNSAHRHRQLYTIMVTSIVTCLATILSVASLWLLSSKPSSWTMASEPPFIYDKVYSIDSPGVKGCGTTVEEATALHCRFDELSDLWLPQHCSRKWEEEYLRSNNGGPFIYWSDPEGKHVISDRSQYAGVATYYSTTRDHLRHCEYNLYRFADSLTTGDLVGHAEGFGPHMHHCANILGKFANLAPDIDNIDVDTISTFGFC